MTTYIQDVSLNTIDEVINLALDNMFPVETYEGVLNDTHIIYAQKELTIGNRDPHNYIVCSYRYRNANSNTLHIMLTDDFSDVEPYIPSDYVA